MRINELLLAFDKPWKVRLFYCLAISGIWLAIYIFSVSGIPKSACTYLPSNIKFIDIEFKDGLCSVRDTRTAKLGFIDKKGNWAIECLYDGKDEIAQGFLRVSKNGKCSYIDKRGREITPFIYDDLDGFGEYFARVSKGEKLGLINKDGKEIIPCLYENKGYNGEEDFTYWSRRQDDNKTQGVDDCNKNSGGIYDEITVENWLIIVKKDNKYGILSRNGEIGEILYDEIKFDFENQYGYAVISGKYKFIDSKGLILPELYKEISSNRQEELVPFCSINDKWGYINKRGKQIIASQFDSADPFNEDLAGVSKNGKWGLINKKGEWTVPPRFDDISHFGEGLAIFKEGEMEGVINNSGEIIAPSKYDYISSFSGNFASAQFDGKRGFIDKNGAIAVPFIYDGTGDFHDNYAVVNKEHKHGLIDTSGKEILPCEYEQIDRNGSYIIAKKPGEREYYIIIKEGKILNEGFYDKPPHFQEDMRKIIICRNGKYGLVGASGEELPCEYANYSSVCRGVYYFQKENEKKVFILSGTNKIFDAGNIEGSYNGYFSFSNSKKCGATNLSGKLIIPCEYDGVSFFGEGYAYVKKSDQRGYCIGYFDVNGNLAIPFKYRQGYSFHEGLARVGNGKTSWFIDYQGNPVISETRSLKEQFSDFYKSFAEIIERRTGIKMLLLPF